MEDDLNRRELLRFHASALSKNCEFTPSAMPSNGDPVVQAAAEVTSYLEEHKVGPAIEEALEATVSAKPRDPCTHLGLTLVGSGELVRFRALPALLESLHELSTGGAPPADLSGWLMERLRHMPTLENLLDIFTVFNIKAHLSIVRAVLNAEAEAVTDELVIAVSRAAKGPEEAAEERRGTRKSMKWAIREVQMQANIRENLKAAMPLPPGAVELLRKLLDRVESWDLDPTGDVDSPPTCEVNPSLTQAQVALVRRVAFSNFEPAVLDYHALRALRDKAVFGRPSGLAQPVAIITVGAAGSGKRCAAARARPPARSLAAAAACRRCRRGARPMIQRLYSLSFCVTTRTMLILRLGAAAACRRPPPAAACLPAAAAAPPAAARA